MLEGLYLVRLMGDRFDKFFGEDFKVAFLTKETAHLYAESQLNLKYRDEWKAANDRQYAFKTSEIGDGVSVLINIYW